MAGVSDNRLEVVVYAGYNQFYVSDDAATHSAEEDDGIWDGAALEDHLAVGTGWLAVLTATYGYVRVELEALTDAPGDDLEGADHVVEASLDVAGSLVVIEETTEKGRLALPPGTYRARVSWLGLDRAREGESEQDDPAETARIELWLARPIETRVLKWYWEWKPSEERPENPHGLRVLRGGREIEAADTGMRVVGHRPEPDGSKTALIRDADGTYWERYYSEEPPYDEVMLEIPASEIGRFTLLPQKPEPRIWELDDAEFERALALSQNERYAYFVKRVAESGWMWFLDSDDGEVHWQSEDDGRISLLVWPHPRFAEAYAEAEEYLAEYRRLKPAPIAVRDWLEPEGNPYAPDEAIVFPTAFPDVGLIVAARALADDLRAAQPKPD
jgi:hypothetical protein